MKITIIPQDGVVSIDGVSRSGIDLSSIDPSFHAIQWFGEDGEIEIKNARDKHIENREITSFDEFAFVIPLWEAADAEVKKKQAEFEAILKEHENLALEMEEAAKKEAEYFASLKQQSPEQ